MADEPERRVVGAIHAELERQRTERGDASYTGLYLGEIDSLGLLYLDGEVDLYLLARAVIAETKENPV
jgi:hypothetical protein